MPDNVPMTARTFGSSHPCLIEYWRKNTAPMTIEMPAIAANSRTPTRPSQSNAGFRGRGGAGGGGGRGGGAGGFGGAGGRDPSFISGVPIGAATGAGTRGATGTTGGGAGVGAFGGAGAGSATGDGPTGAETLSLIFRSWRSSSAVRIF